MQSDGGVEESSSAQQDDKALKKTKAENEMSPISKKMRAESQADSKNTCSQETPDNENEFVVCNEKNTQSKRRRVTNGMKRRASGGTRNRRKSGMGHSHEGSTFGLTKGRRSVRGKHRWTDGDWTDGERTGRPEESLQCPLGSISARRSLC